MNRLGEYRGGSSLRARVSLLAGVSIVLLLVTLAILIAVVRDSHAALVNSAARHLDTVALRASAAYAARSDRSVGLSSISAGPEKPPPLSGELFDGGGSPLPPPPPPPPPHDAHDPAEPLSAFMRDLLHDQPGMEGGFFRADTGALGGYAFPTHEGPGPNKEMPLREQPAIREVAARAAATGKPQSSVFAGAHDAVLFAAVPVCDVQPCTGRAAGAIWLMQRLPGAESEHRRTVLWSAFAFGLMSLLMVALAFRVLSQVDGSVNAVLQRLTSLGSSLTPEIGEQTAHGLVEFQRVLEGLDGLALALRTQRETERTLQARLQQGERLAAIGQLAAGVAHELRNPLATIRLRAQMAQRSADLPAAAHHSSTILAEVDRLDSIIERLLTFARPVRLNTARTNVAALCREAAERWSDVAGRPRLAVRYAGATDAEAEVDATRLRQVVDNLIENALHAQEEQHGEQQVVISCATNGQEVFIQVVDEGIGFTGEALSHALEPFFTTRSSGTGLGLPIAYEIVKAHGGSLRHFNRPEGGAAVELSLPLAQQQWSA